MRIPFFSIFIRIHISKRRFMFFIQCSVFYVHRVIYMSHLMLSYK